MAEIIRWIGALSRFFAGIAAAMLVISVALVCQMAVMEYWVGVPAPWLSDVVSYLMIGITFLGTPYVFATGGHVTVDFYGRPPGSSIGRLRRALAALISGVFAVAFTIASAALLFEALHQGWRGDDSGWMALWIPYLTLPIGTGLLSLQCLAEVVAAASGETDLGEEAADAAGFPD